MNYSQFLNMIPEATLMVVLLITFIADFCSSQERRPVSGSILWYVS